jgi:hypothetical protein
MPPGATGYNRYSMEVHPSPRRAIQRSAALGGRSSVRTAFLAAFWFFLALLFAAMYASVESRPYAEGLPTWRPDPARWWVQILFWFPNLGRPVNGLDTFGLLFLGMTSLLLVPIWNALHRRPCPWHELLELVSYFVAIAVVEDWVWYAINPHAGFKCFNSASLPRWMYAAWFLGFPSQYWEGLFASYASMLASTRINARRAPLALVLHSSLLHFAIIWIVMVILVLATAVFANYTWMAHRNF